MLEKAKRTYRYCKDWLDWAMLYPLWRRGRRGREMVLRYLMQESYRRRTESADAPREDIQAWENEGGRVPDAPALYATEGDLMGLHDRRKK